MSDPSVPHVSFTLPSDTLSLETMTLQAVNSMRQSRQLMDISIGIGGSIVGDVVERNGVLYFGACDKNVYAVSAETGEEQWHFSTSGVNSDCRVTNDALYISSYDTHLYAIGLDGSLLWKFKTDGKVSAYPLVIEDGIIVGSEDGRIYCLDKGGHLEWTFYLKSPLGFSDLGRDEDTIYAGCVGGTLFAIDFQGRLKWKYQTNGLCGGAAVLGDRVFFGSWDHHLYCIDRRTGKLLWKFAAKDKITTRTVVIHHNLLYTGSYDKNLYCIDTEGKLKWTFPTQNVVFSFPVIEGTKLFFGAVDSNYYCLDAVCGKEIWRFSSGGPIVGNSAKWMERVFYGGYDCKLYCIATDGRLLWTFPTSMSTISSVDVIETPSVEYTMQAVVQQERHPEEIRYRTEEQTEINYGQQGVYLTTSPYLSTHHYLQRKKQFP